jgi:hypothetical protein
MIRQTLKDITLHGPAYSKRIHCRIARRERDDHRITSGRGRAPSPE